MSASKQELQKAAARLASGPGFEDWKNFMTAFRFYVIDLKDQHVQAPVDRLQVTQGHAQQAIILRDLFDGAVAAMEKLKK